MSASLRVFVPGRLSNPLNGSHRHWRARWAWSRRWREATATAIRRAGAGGVPGHLGPPSTPKLVRFEARVWSLFDDDGLRAALKPVRDGLADAGLIHADGPGSGHRFEYAQVIDRRRRGVALLARKLEALGSPPGAFAENHESNAGESAESMSR